MNESQGRPAGRQKQRFSPLNFFIGLSMFAASSLGLLSGNLNQSTSVLLAFLIMAASGFLMLQEGLVFLGLLHGRLTDFAHLWRFVSSSNHSEPVSQTEERRARLTGVAVIIVSAGLVAYLVAAGSFSGKSVSTTEWCSEVQGGALIALNRGEPVAVAGARVSQPIGERWAPCYARQGPAVTFGFVPTSDTHTIFASMSSGNLAAGLEAEPDLRKLEPRDLVVTLARAWAQRSYGGRGTLKESEFAPAPFNSSECARAYTLFEDMQVPGYEGVLFRSAQWARVCLHPNGQFVIVMFISERLRSTESAWGPLSEERDSWMAQLEFTD